MELNTKADFTALMYQFLDPLKPYYSEGCARLHLGETGAKYKQSTIELEAFSRPQRAAARTRNLNPSTAKALPPVRTRKAPNTGAGAKTTTTPSGQPKPPRCLRWMPSSPCPLPTCWCSAGRAG